jgi:hypothetical protein
MALGRPVETHMQGGGPHTPAAPNPRRAAK